MDAPVKKIAIVGAGAVGCYYGARLTHSDLDVHFLMRSDLDHVRKQGLQIDSVDPDLSMHLDPVNCANRSEDIGMVDLVIVALKTTDNSVLDQIIPPLLNEHTMLLTLQNGMGNEEYLAERFGAERVLGGLCFVCLNRVSPGVIRHIGHGLIEMGEFSGPPQPRTRAIAELLIESGVPCNLAESLHLSRWRKLVWNVPFNGLSIAAGGIDVGQILADKHLHQRVTILMREIVATASKAGYEIPETFIEENLARTYPMGGYQPSSLLDYLEGRAVEVEAIWGEPLRRGHAIGAEMPELARLYQEIKAQINR